MNKVKLALLHKRLTPFKVDELIKRVANSIRASVLDTFLQLEANPFFKGLHSTGSYVLLSV